MLCINVYLPLESSKTRAAVGRPNKTPGLHGGQRAEFSMKHRVQLMLLFSFFWPSLQQMLATYRANRRMPLQKNHVQSRHLPRNKQIDLGFHGYSLVPRRSTMYLRDQCVYHLLIRHRLQNAYWEEFFDVVWTVKKVPGHHFLQAFRARSKVFVSCGIDMGEICQLALGRLHPQVRRMWLIRLIDWHCQTGPGMDRWKCYVWGKAGLGTTSWVVKLRSTSMGKVIRKRIVEGKTNNYHLKASKRIR